MYQDFFHLNKYPFHNTLSPTFFFEGKQQRKLLYSLNYGVQESSGILLITGKTGSGKSMMARRYSSRLGPEWQVININNPWITTQELLQLVHGKITVAKEVQRAKKVSLDMIHQRLLYLDAKGARVLLIIDEAQFLSQETLECLRFLQDLESDNRKLLSILMMGQEELEALLKTDALRALQQRIRLTYSLEYMSPDETDAYIQHRLKVAGGDPNLFSRECIDLVHQVTHGCPRLVNNICDETLLTAFGRSQTHITTEIVWQAAGGLLSEDNSQSDTSSGPAQAQGRAPEGVSGGDRDKEKGGARHHRAGSRLRGRIAKRVSGKGQEPAQSIPELAPIHDPAESLADHAQAMQSLHLPYDELEPSHRSAHGLWIGLAATALVLGLTGWNAWKAWLEDTGPSAVPASTVKTPEKDAGLAGSVEPLPPAPKAPASNLLSLPHPASSHKVRIDAKTPLTLLAAEYFGAWNATVLDMLGAINAGLDLEHAPSGTVIQTPYMTRADLIVADEQGRFFLYYASFDDEAEAQSNLQSLRLMTQQAFLQSTQRAGKAVWRLYAGPYTSHDAASKAANSLWFKFLPLLN